MAVTFKSFLSAVGNDVKAVFGWLGSAQGQTAVAGVEGAATAVTTVINPGLGAALTGVEGLFNAALKQIISTEALAAAAGAQSGSGAQKSAAVVSAITPQIPAFLTSIGISAPTTQQVNTVATAVTNGLVAILNSIPPAAA